MNKKISQMELRIILTDPEEIARIKALSKYHQIANNHYAHQLIRECLKKEEKKMAKSQASMYKRISEALNIPETGYLD